MSARVRDFFNKLSIKVKTESLAEVTQMLIEIEFRQYWFIAKLPNGFNKVIIEGTLGLYLTKIFIDDLTVLPCDDLGELKANIA